MLSVPYRFLTAQLPGCNYCAAVSRRSIDPEIHLRLIFVGLVAIACVSAFAAWQVINGFRIKRLYEQLLTGSNTPSIAHESWIRVRVVLGRRFCRVTFQAQAAMHDQSLFLKDIQFVSENQGLMHRPYFSTDDSILIPLKVVNVYRTRRGRKLIFRDSSLPGLTIYSDRPDSKHSKALYDTALEGLWQKIEIAAGNASA